MKRIFTLTISFLLASVFLTSCIRETIYENNDNYWLSKEMGEVVYSDPYCNYYVVETFNGYNIVRTYGGYKPYYCPVGKGATREFKKAVSLKK